MFKKLTIGLCLAASVSLFGCSISKLKPIKDEPINKNVELALINRA